MMFFSFPRRCAHFFGASFLLVVVWKFILLLGTAQPIPANDAFVYDGAVVNYLLHGQYCNPSVILAFPFAGTHLFCIYPPLYQAGLFLWMSVFGTSVLSPMWFHFVLFGLYALTLLAIFRRLQTPAWAVNLAGLFLFGITFDDRPDSLAQLLGMLALYAWVRSWEPPRVSASHWAWLAALAVVLACCTNPELGGMYFGWVWLLVLGGAVTRQSRVPWLPVAFMTVAPVALVAYVKYGRPDIWAGFMEHASQTPSLTNWRLPSAGDLLKTARTMPAILLAGGLLLCRWWHLDRSDRPAGDGPADQRPMLLLLTGFLITAGLVAGGLFRFTANWILFLYHVQPLLVGAFLTLEARRLGAPRRWIFPAFTVMVLIVSVRAIGLSTWGVACALDRSQAEAMKIVATELDRLPPDATVVMSTAFLYDAQTHPRLHFIHEDWTHRADQPAGKLNDDTLGVVRLKPAALILTQFDFYRHYHVPMAELDAMPTVVTLATTNYARVRSPDSYPRFQQVLQHVAWAPVVVELDWKQPVPALGVGLGAPRR